MNAVLPHVRIMLLCDDARPRRDNPMKIDVFGLVSVVRFASSREFPCKHSFCVYAVLTEVRSDGEGRIVVVDADSGEEAHTGIPFDLQSDANPLTPHGMIVRVPSCSFPKPGLYWVELRYNNHVIAQEQLIVLSHRNS